MCYNEQAYNIFLHQQWNILKIAIFIGLQRSKLYA
jgi:hypothetical protein